MKKENEKLTKGGEKLTKGANEGKYFYILSQSEQMKASTFIFLS